MHDNKEIFNILQYYLRKYTHNENGDVKYAGMGRNMDVFNFINRSCLFEILHSL